MAINFVCPYCQSQQSVPENMAGVNVPCKDCGQMVAAPLPYNAAPRGSGGGTWPILVVLGVTALVAVLGCGGVMVALLLPAVNAGRGAARSVSSQGHMKMILLALHNYHDAHKTFPPAYIADADGQPMHSWRVLILPYVEEQMLYQQYDFSQPWDSPANMAIAERVPPVYKSPLEDGDMQKRTHTSYLLVIGNGSAYPSPDQGITFGDIPDGTSNTIALVEVNRSGVIWTQPTDLDVAQLDYAIRTLDQARPGQLNTASPRGLHVGTYDGAVRVLPFDTPPATLQNAMGASDGAPVMLP